MKHQCTICEKSYLGLNNLRKHLKQKHNIHPDGKCICGKEFQSSQSLNAHYRWCELKRGDRPKLYSPNKGKISYRKGLKLEQIVSNPEETRKKFKAWKRIGTAHTQISKKKLSEARTKFLESSLSHIKWFEIGGIKVQGSWEKFVAEKLIEAGIKIERIKLNYDCHRQYTPDFYLPSLNIYIEVKGWFSDRDKNKYKRVLKDHSDKKIKFIHGKKNVFDFDVSKINDLPDMKNVI